MTPAHTIPRIFGPLDGLIAAALLCGAAVALPALRQAGPVQVLVYRDNHLLARYPLSAQAEFTVDGAHGAVRVRIAGGRAHIVSSSCPNKICMATGAVSSPGATIACAPNHVLLQLIGGKKDSPDAVAQ